MTLNINADGYFPLRRGTRAIIRPTSLSGVANRYVDLQLGGADGADIPDGGRLPTENTVAAVDLERPEIRLADPSTGRVTLGGVDLRRLSLDDVADTVGVVAQDTYLLHASVRDNLLHARPEADDDEPVPSGPGQPVHPGRDVGRDPAQLGL